MNNAKISQQQTIGNEHYMNILPVRGNLKQSLEFTFPTRMDAKDKHPLLKADGNLIYFHKVTTPSTLPITTNPPSSSNPTNPTTASTTTTATTTTTSNNNNNSSTTAPVTTIPMEQSSSNTLPDENAVKGYVIRANEFVPPSCGIFYFECTIMSNENEAPIFVGFSTGNVSLHFLPGMIFI
jgi:hypothetical protein